MCVCVEQPVPCAWFCASLSSLHLWLAATSPYHLPHYTCWDEFDTWRKWIGVQRGEWGQGTFPEVIFHEQSVLMHTCTDKLQRKYTLKHLLYSRSRFSVYACFSIFRKKHFSLNSTTNTQVEEFTFYVLLSTTVYLPSALILFALLPAQLTQLQIQLL